MWGNMKKVFLIAAVTAACLSHSEDCAFTFYNIMPYAPGAEERSAKDMVEYHDRTGNDICLYSLSIHAEGRPAMRKAGEMVESYRKLSRLLKGSGVKLGILLQSTLGHWLRQDTEQEQWTRTVDIEGNAKRFCPFDPDFRAYIAEVVRQLAAEHPAIVMGDDDIRAFSPKMECFCPLHVAEFNRRTGKSLTADELRKAVADGKKGDETFDAFVKLQRDTITGFAAHIRATLDSVDPSIPGAACMPGWPYERAWSPRTAEAFAAKGQRPILRIANAYYCERTPDGLASSSVGTMACLAYHHGFPNLLDESDTCPHNIWSKSASTLHQKLAMAAACGLNGSKIRYVNGHKGGHPVSRHYTDMLARYSGYHNALAAAVRGTEMLGVVTPVYASFPLGVNEIVTRGALADRVFGRIGVPFRCEMDFSKDGIWCISGEEMVKKLSDDDLKLIFAHRVIVDSKAAIELTKRGQSNLIGVKATPVRAPAYTGEFVPEIGLSCGYSPRWSPPVTFEPEAGAEPFAYLVLRKYSAAKDYERVMPSGLLFRNALGGIVATTVYNASMHVWEQVYEARQDYLAYVLGRLGGADAEYQLMNAQPAQLVARRGDGFDLLTVFNYSYDAMENATLRCARTPRSVERLDDHGTWRAAKFTPVAGGRIVVDGEVASCGVAAYRVKN